MKRLITFILATIILAGILSCSVKRNVAKSSEAGKVKLRWKIKDTVEYVMETIPLDTSEIYLEMKKILDTIYHKIQPNITSSRDSLKNPELSVIEKALNRYFNKSENFLYIFPSDKYKNVIDIEIIEGEKQKNDSANKSSLDTPGSILLKAAVYEDGSLHSFWLKNEQRNLISLYFELPKQEVKKGDTWSLECFNGIQFGFVFYCEKSEKRNEVRLADIIETEKDTIAVLQYDIYELCQGPGGRVWQ